MVFRSYACWYYKIFTDFLSGYLIVPLNGKLNPIWHLPALLGAHYIIHVSRIRVNVDGSVVFMSVPPSFLFIFTTGLTENTQGHKVHQVVLPEWTVATALK
jgi:hypothetical protein